MHQTSRPARHRYVTPKFVRSAAAALAVGMAIALSSFGVVRAEHKQGAKTKAFNCASGTACLEGNANGFGTYGILGTSSGNTGIVGNTSASNGSSGVAGVSNSQAGTGLGIYGYSSNGAGVYGISSAYGAPGVAAFQLNTSSNAGHALYAEGADSTGGFHVIYGQGDSAATTLFEVDNVPNDSYCGIDALANLYCTGTTEVKTVRTRHQTSTGQHVLAYAAESASATLEDVGTAHMDGGVASVALDRAFGSAIDRTAYHVFLTPYADASLYVAQKTPGGFIVRETRGGRSTLDFDYRIVARPIDAKGDRLPLAVPAKHAHEGMRPAR